MMLLELHRYPADSLVVFDFETTGLSPDMGDRAIEIGAVLIENGIYKGYAYYDLNYQITNIDILKNILVPMQHNRDVKNIIQSYIRKSKSIKILQF